MNGGLGALYAGLFLISLWSWYTTGAGWHALLGDIWAIFPFGLAAIMQFVLAVMALHVVPGGKSLVAWPVAIAIYVLLAITSVTFSIGFYFQLTAAEDYAERIFEDQYSAVIQNAEELTLAYQNGADQLESFAAFSRRMAEQEATRGGTCREDRGGGRGPFFELRTFQADRFSTIADEVDQRRTRIESALQAVRAVAEQEALPVEQRLERLKTRYRKLQAVYTQNIGGLTEKLREHRQWHANGYPDKPRFSEFAGEQYACGDGVSLSRFEDVINVLAALPEAGQYEIEVFDPNDQGQVINEILGAVLGFFASGEANEDDETSAVDQQIFSEAYRTAVSLGLLVDSVILLLGIFIQLANRPTRLFWRRVPSPSEVRLVSDLFVKFQERCRHLRYLNDPAYVGSPIEPDVTRASGQRPESVGAAADFVEAVLEKIEVQVEQGSYLFEPEKDAVLDEVGVELQDLVQDVREILSDNRLIGEPAYNRGNDFLGRNLGDLKANFGIGEGALDESGLLTAYQVDPVLQRKILQRMSAYASSRIDRVPGVPAWWQRLNLWSNNGPAHHLALVLDGNDRARARYVNDKRLPGTHRVLLSSNHEAENDLICWLRSPGDHLGFHDHVRERPVTLFGIDLPFLNWRIMELNDEADRVIMALANEDAS